MLRNCTTSGSPIVLFSSHGDGASRIAAGRLRAPELYVIWNATHYGPPQCCAEHSFDLTRGRPGAPPRSAALLWDGQSSGRRFERSVRPRGRTALSRRVNIPAVVEGRPIEQGIREGRSRCNDEDEGAAPALRLPPGSKNYMTGAAMTRCASSSTSSAASSVRGWSRRWPGRGNGDRSENGDYIYGKKRLREIDRRIRFLIKRIESAEVVDPERQQGLEQVFFGATVTFKRLDTEEEQTLQIVGMDVGRRLAGADQAWISPLARAVLKARAGDACASTARPACVRSRSARCGTGERGRASAPENVQVGAQVAVHVKNRSLARASGLPRKFLSWMNRYACASHLLTVGRRLALMLLSPSGTGGALGRRPLRAGRRSPAPWLRAQRAEPGGGGGRGGAAFPCARAVRRADRAAAQAAAKEALRGLALPGQRVLLCQ